MLFVYPSLAQQVITLEPGSSIQNTIENANQGAIILLKKGVYRGDVHLRRSISLIGIGDEPSVIQGNANGIPRTVMIYGTGSKLENLRITQDTSSFPAGLDSYPNTMGILLEAGSNHSIVNCEIQDHITGIYVSSSSGNQIERNRFTNVGNGILFAGFSDNSSENQVTNNSFYSFTRAQETDDAAVKVIPNYRGSNNQVTQNNFVAQSGLAANNQTAEVFAAISNWWGSASGPQHSGNPSGTGAPVSDLIDYGSFLVDPAVPTAVEGRLSATSRIIPPNGRLNIQLQDEGLNLNPAVVESAVVMVFNDSTADQEAVVVRETNSNSSVFTGSILTRTAASSIAPSNGLLNGTIDDIVYATYNGDTLLYCVGSGFSGVLSASDFSPGEIFKVKLDDPEISGDSVRVSAIYSNENEEITLIKTEPGIFEGSISTALRNTSSSSNDGILQVFPNTQVGLRYNDANTAFGNPGTSNKTVRVLENVTRYSIDSTASVACLGDSFAIPIKADSSIQGAIGLDFSIQYDPSVMQPTGNLILSGSEVVAPEHVEGGVFDNSGSINVTLYLNNNAPQNATFSGSGEVCSIEFRSLSNLPFEQSTLVESDQVVESYLTRTEVAQVVPAQLSGGGISVRLVTWADNTILGYRGDNQFIPTNVQLATAECLPKGEVKTPDEGGVVPLSAVNQSDKLLLRRDINDTVRVMSAVNGMDAQIAQLIVLEVNTFTPEPWQIIAADVNQDGVVSAGDITQINRRTVHLIPEFVQVWNYDDNGNSNGQASVDWGWTGNKGAANLQLSSNYPADDGIGVSRSRVPNISYCVDFTKSSCDSTDVYGLLLGDVDGNVSDTLSYSGLRTEQNSEVTLLLDQGFSSNGDEISIPFSIELEGDLFALDAAIRAGRADVEVLSIEVSGDIRAEQNNISESELLFTSFSVNPYSQLAGEIVVRIPTGASSLTGEDFLRSNMYVNGNRANLRVEGTLDVDAVTAINDPILEQSVQIYPNPTASNVTLEMVNDFRGDVNLRIIDISGRAVWQTSSTKYGPEFNHSLPTEQLQNGIYFIAVDIEGRKLIKRVVLNK